MVEMCYKRCRTSVNPIIDWTDADVWEFIKGEGIPYCELYDEGFDRIGCIGCPIAGKKKREHEFLRYPKFRNAYVKAFDKMLIEREKKGLPTEWMNGEDVFNWWMEYKIVPGQMSFFDKEYQELLAEYDD